MLTLDLYGQYPVSWLITPTETAEGAVKVFEKAQISEGALAPLIHTDRGAAYTSKAFNQYLVINNAQHSYSAPVTPADNAVIEHWWADFKAIWIAHLPKAQTLVELEQQVKEGITYFTEEFISAKRNDLTAAEAIMPSKYTDEIENSSDTWRVFLYGKKIKIFTPAKVNYY